MIKAGAALAGICLITFVLVDAFNTIILARRTRYVFRITRYFYRATWTPFAAAARRIRSGKHREGFLSIYGPLSLLMLFALWAIGLAAGFGLLQWAAGMQPEREKQSLANDFYLSATTLTTTQTGGPQNSSSKAISAIEGALGISFLGLVVGYLPVLYQSFSKRELRISMLDARAGSPPSAQALLQHECRRSEKLEHQLETWEEWAAEVLENQLSFPMLGYFRSHHPNQSWLTALVAMMDTTAVILLSAEGDLETQAALTFAMGRHTLADLRVTFCAAEALRPIDRLSGNDFTRIRQAVVASGGSLQPRRLSESELRELRQMYETDAKALSDHFLMALPNWLSLDESRRNWRTSLRDRDRVPYAVSDPFRENSDE